jgi:DNA-binding transcriptional LysR family regulator
MDVRQLNALVAIADSGSFSAAAQALDTVQSNISAHVKKLEQELNVILIDRASGTLTSAGDVVVERARRAQRELDALRDDVLALQHDVSGTVRIGIIGTTARWLVPQLLAVSPGRFPDLRLVFVESTTTALQSQITAAQVDLAVLNLPHSSQDMLLTPLFEEELVLIAARSHPLGGRREISVADLDGVPLLLPLRGTAFRRELDEAVNACGVRLLAKAEVDGTRLIASLTFEGYGPAILPATALPGYLVDRWSVVRVKEIPPRLIGVAQRPQTLPSAPVRAVFEMLTHIVFTPTFLPGGLTPVPADRMHLPAEPPNEPPGAAPYDGG